MTLALRSASVPPGPGNSAGLGLGVCVHVAPSQCIVKVKWSVAVPASLLDHLLELDDRFVEPTQAGQGRAEIDPGVDVPRIDPQRPPEHGQGLFIAPVATVESAEIRHRIAVIRIGFEGAKQ